MATTGAEKQSQVENDTSTLNEQDVVSSVERDRFGAAVKTDPQEIALVRKVDVYMMVRVALFASFAPPCRSCSTL